MFARVFTLAVAAASAASVIAAPINANGVVSKVGTTANSELNTVGKTAGTVVADLKAAAPIRRQALGAGAVTGQLTSVTAVVSSVKEQVLGGNILSTIEGLTANGAVPSLEQVQPVIDTVVGIVDQATGALKALNGNAGEVNADQISKELTAVLGQLVTTLGPVIKIAGQNKEIANVLLKLDGVLTGLISTLSGLVSTVLNTVLGSLRGSGLTVVSDLVGGLLANGPAAGLLATLLGHADLLNSLLGQLPLVGGLLSTLGL